MQNIIKNKLLDKIFPLIYNKTDTSLKEGITMPQKNKIKRFPAVTSCVLFVLMGALKVMVPSDGFYQTLVFVCSNVVYLGIIFCWGVYVERSILSPKIRRLMLSVVVFMIMYILIGSAKSRIFLDGNFAGRFLWYLYYVPQIFATFLSFVIAFRVGKREDYKMPVIFRYFLVHGIVIVLLYLTNDIHQLAFRFNIDFVAWDQQYDWGVLFYISTAWIYAFLIVSVIMLSIKCRAVDKKKAWIPIFWLVLGSFYIFSDYIFDIWNVAPYNLPESHCFILIAMFESCIRIGIMPSNSAYGQIVAKSSAAFQIADESNNVVYCSDNAVHLTSEQMNEAKGNETYIDKNTLLLSNKITGGYVYWTEDMTEIKEISENLSQISQSLSEEGDIIRAENDIREQRAKIAEQTRLYDSISDFVRPKLEEISMLIEDDGDFHTNMAHICILNCYVKRRSNLVLLKDREPFFSSEELLLSLKESAEYIRLHGGSSAVFSDKDEVVSADIIILCFDLWQYVVEEFLPEPCMVTAGLNFDDDMMKFRISVETEKALGCHEAFYKEATRLGGHLSEITEDGVVYITLRVRKDGGVL